MKDFDVYSIRVARPPEIAALSISIQRTIEKYFGENTPDCHRFSRASRLNSVNPYVMEVDLQLSDYKTDVKNNIFHSIAILEQAIKTLIEDIEDENQIIVDPDASVLKITVSQSRRVFVVHGHDEGARETVARFLERTGFEAVILHEQANEGRAIIEKFEAHGEVGFAVILLTPDDVGSTKGGNLKPRARQNVILELGYFFGRLGRNRVAALKRGDIELPSDFDGIVYTPFDNGSGWQVALAKELIAAGFEIDWNKVYN